MLEYSAKVGEALDYFIQNVIMPEDWLYIATPVKGYGFAAGFPADIPREKISEGLKDTIKRDIVKSSRDYLSLIDTLQEIRKTDVPPELKESMESRYADTLEKLAGFSFMEESKLIGFAENLKKRVGQKHVLIFFQKRMIPLWGSFTASGTSDQNVVLKSRFFDFFNPRTYLDEDKVKEAFSDSSISCHFLYVTNRPTYVNSGMEMNPAEEGQDEVKWQDRTADFFNTFKQISAASGGIIESSANIYYSLKKAVEASENYYLLYYAPKNYKADGKFKKIKVEVKGKRYRVTHRAGYFAEEIGSELVAEAESSEKIFYSVANGLEKYRAGDLEGAIEIYTGVINSDPQNALAYYNRAIVYEELGDTSRAFEDYTKAIEIRPDYAEAYNNRGCLLVDDREYEQSIEDFTLAIKMKPDYASAYFNRGNALMGLREYRKAIPDLKKAMELDPTEKENVLEKIKFCESRIKNT
jgi:tetratricopeptide (TPR) repeat protein